MLALHTLSSPRLRSIVPFATRPKYTTYRDISSLKMKKTRTVVGRFTTDVENFHGRIAMVGLTGCALDETLSKLPILQQLTTETGIPSIQIVAFVVVITTAFILETFNPVVVKTEEPELEIFTKPGFTLETEILHGRMAMLAFAYALLSEQLYAQLVL
jgi:Chlorophyll A-B binding protein